MPPKEIPITSGTVLRWWHVAIVAGTLFAGVIGWQVRTSMRLDAVEEHANKNEARIADAEKASNALDKALDKKLSELNQKMDVVVLCMRHPNECDENLRLLSAIH